MTSCVALKKLFNLSFNFLIYKMKPDKGFSEY